jgi:polyadenylate-binding protein
VNFHTIRDAERVLDTMNYTLIKQRMCRLMWSQRDPSLRKSGEGNVFIKNLDPSIDSKDLFDTFSIFGNIISCKVVTDRQSGQSKGYGFVHFETQEAANEAIAKVNGNVISGRVVYVGNFVKRDQRVKSMQWTNLYMKNVPYAWDEKKIQEICAKFGEIASVKVMYDDDKKSKGFGYIDFKEHEAAKKCVDTMHGMEIETEEEVPVTAADTKAAEGGAEEEKMPEEADGAKEEVKKTEKKMVKKTLYVQRFMKKRERERIVSENKIREKAERIKSFIGKNLYVRNLSDAVTEEKLRQEFANYGTIKSCRVMKDEQQRSRGFGFVCMENREEATKALQTLNNMMFLGKPLYVALWQPRDERRQFLQRQHMAKRGQMGSPMSARGMPMQMGMAGGMGNYQMPLGMYAHAGPRGFPRPMYNQRMMHPRGYPNMYAQNMFGNSSMMHPRTAGGMPRGMPRGPAGPRGMPGMPGQQRNFNTQARNVPPQQMPQQPQQPPTAEVPAANAALTSAALVGVPSEMQKNMIGERLYPLVQQQQPDLAGKVTGMLLDGMETGELLHLLESPEDLQSKIREAMEVLESAQVGEERP